MCYTNYDSINQLSPARSFFSPFLIKFTKKVSLVHSKSLQNTRGPCTLKIISLLQSLASSFFFHLMLFSTLKFDTNFRRLALKLKLIATTLKTFFSFQKINFFFDSKKI